MSELMDMAKRAENREGQLKQLLLADIEPNEKNFYGLRDVEELAENILAVGLLQPLVVEPAPAGSEKPYRLLTGGRRYAAMVANLAQGGPEAAPCIVQRPADEDEEVLHIISTNQYRKLTYWEKLQGVLKLTEAVKRKKAEGVSEWHGLNIDELTVKQAVVKLSGLSRAEASKYGTIAEKLVPELLPFVEEGRMAFTVAYDVCQLPEWAQRELAKQKRYPNGILFEIGSKDYSAELARVRERCEEETMGELMLALGRFLDPVATVAQNADRLKMLKAEGSVGEIEFKVWPYGGIEIHGIKNECFESMHLACDKLCKLAAEKYGDRMTGDWRKKELEAEVTRKKAEEKKAEALRERAAKKEEEKAAVCLCKSCTCTGCHEECFGHCTGCGERQTHCNSYQTEGEKFPLWGEAATADVQPEQPEEKKTGDECEECRCRSCENAHCDERCCEGNPDYPYCFVDDCDSYRGNEKKDPGGWVKVVSSAGPWPERSCPCAVKEERGYFSIKLWDADGKRWCFTDRIDGELCTACVKVRMWCELPDLPEGDS